MRYAIRFVLAASLSAAAAACTAPPTSASADSGQSATPVPAKPRPTMGGPMPPQRVQAGQVDRSCSTDADCTVKDVRNCCGAMPACVNVNAQIDPAKVQEDCKRGGGMAVCGFPAIESCKCSRGKCVALAKPVDPIVDPAPAPPVEK